MKVNTAVHSAKEAFFARLPRAALSAEEARLLGQLKAVGDTVSLLLPRGIDLQEWAERRVPPEEAERVNASGLVCLATTFAQPPPPLGAPPHRGAPPPPPLRRPAHMAHMEGGGSYAAQPAAKGAGKGKPVAEASGKGKPIPDSQSKVAGKEERGQESEEFFNSLPEDHFTAEEDGMRNSLTEFLKAWPGETPPNLSHAGVDHGIKMARAALMPKGCSLREWIERRCGEEIELMLTPAGQYAIGFVGQLDTETVANIPPGVRQRQREAHAAGDGPPPAKRGKSDGYKGGKGEKSGGQKGGGKH